ncbi:MAG: M20/M25/M40 family metallo-hydrolase [Phycisphaerae bacterium]
MTLVASSRSSSAPHLTAILDQVGGAARLAGYEPSTGDGYPGWAPNAGSKLLAVCRAAYEKEFGEAPIVTAIHAGLECGVIGERVGGMDMISFGPTIKMPHSPDENVSIKSVQKFWRYLRAVLAALAT